MKSLLELKTFLHRQKQIVSAHQYIMAFDPGKTMGWCVFNAENCQLCTYGETKYDEDRITKDMATRICADLVNYQIERVVIEHYRIYEWMAKEHVGSSLFTVRLIGMLETIVELNNLSVYKQQAQDVKKFVTDEKLKQWDLFVKGRHARDAVRHAVYHTLFLPGDK